MNNNFNLAQILDKNYPSEGTKYYKILEYLRLGNSLNSIEAAQKQYYLEIPRESEVVSNAFGSKSKLTRYRLSSDDIVTLDLIK